MDNLELEFEQVVKRHKSTIYTVCYMFSNDAVEVADLFQDVLINMWNGFAKFRGDSDIKTWIWRVSLNTCITAERKKRKHVQLILKKYNVSEADDTAIKRILKEWNKEEEK